MKHSDEHRSPEYFQNYIETQRSRIEKFKQILVGCAESEKAKLYRNISGRLKDLISAQFSNNDELSAIKNSFEEYAECLNQVGFSSYSEYIDFLSLQLILGIEDVSIDAPSEFDDDLIKILKASIAKEQPTLTDTLNYPEYYGVFKEYYLGNIGFNELMDYIDNKWYWSSKEFYWFQSHMREDDIYVGYWCYIASAVIRIKGDYERLRETERYIV